MPQKSSLFLLLLVFIVGSCTKRFEPATGPTGPGDISWEQVGPDSIQVTAVAVHPDGSIFAAVVNSPELLLRSPDEGGSWTTISVPQVWSPEYIKTLAIDETGTIYAAVFNGTSSQLERSFDSGVTWSPTGSLGDIQTIVSDNAGMVYVGTASHDESGGSLRMTNDRGSTWTYANIPDTVGVYCIAVSRLGTVCALTGLGDVLRSTDRGTSWVKSDSGLPAEPLWTLGASPNGMLYVSDGLSEQGIYRSTDDGLSWKSGGLTGYLIDYLVVDARSDVFALAGYQSPRGLFRSTDNGTTWTEVQKGFNDDERVLSFAVTPSGYLFIGASHGLLRSVNSVTQSN